MAVSLVDVCCIIEVYVMTGSSYEWMLRKKDHQTNRWDIAIVTATC